MPEINFWHLQRGVPLAFTLQTADLRFQRIIYLFLSLTGLILYFAAHFSGLAFGLGFFVSCHLAHFFLDLATNLVDFSLCPILLTLRATIIGLCFLVRVLIS